MMRGAKVQYGVLALLSLAAIGLAFGVLLSGGTAFDRYLGPVNPMLAIALASILAVFSMRYLGSRYGFVVFSPSKTLRGVAISAGIAGLFAAGTITVDLALGYPEGINVAWPQSLLFYPSVGYFVDLFFHVSGLALLLIVLRPLARKVSNNRLVWLCIIIAALIEPVLQVIWGGSLSWISLYTGLSITAFGVVQLFLFRRYGFVTMYSLRLSYYVLWHIVWGYVRLGVLF